MLGAAALPFLVSLFAVWLLVPLAKHAAARWGFIDLPRPDRIHAVPTPKLGGAAVALALAAALLPRWNSIPAGFLAGAAIAAALGLIDDRHPLPSAAKLCGQTLAAVSLVAVGAHSHSLGVLALAAFWTVALMNALNLLDNQDGALCAAAIPAALGLGAMALLARAPVLAAGSFALAGGLAGFLRFNRPPASIFLGDTGSLSVGFALAALTLALAAHSGSMPRAFAPAFVLAYPLFDLTFVTVTRLATGRRIDEGGMDHTTHRLAAALGSVGRADAVIAAVSTVFVVMAIGRFLGGAWIAFAGSAILALGFFAWLGITLLRYGR